GRVAERKAELAGALARHAAFYAAYGDEWRLKMPTERGLDALKRIGLDEENLLGASTWAGDAEAAAKAALAWVEIAGARGPYLDIRPTCEACLARLPDSPLRPLLLMAAARGEYY